MWKINANYFTERERDSGTKQGIRKTNVTERDKQRQANKILLWKTQENHSQELYEC